ncbi:MAG: Asp-tRNA(Asn)/Glu-tRNA(Gln) amidotransferase subunit GatB [Holosporales bacterium]|jgi:aspartyl-tRNA(Asn)/glutamyl-tRNA(Gln) amidotransferase subunit B|nr:Asp-tRNA(Asn)/Glu-tRNA(Gln) amidotransferase subunit GatB [Holosporales bacterium]
MSDLVNGKWEVVIGLEVHAQIASRSKLFSGSAIDGEDGANTRVSFFDVGMPGTLPVINSRCVDQAIRTGIGVHGQVNKISVFDRKNYFYPDLPSGYQISQFFFPIVTGGYLDIDVADETFRIGLTRIHMEQDAGKSIHDLDPNRSFVDFNRAGIALMEIVSNPDMRSVEQAVAFAKKLHTLVKYLGTCDGNMEKGNYRIDANVSLHEPGTPFGTRVEIKNLNSFKFMQSALLYEIERQADVIEKGNVVVQETRLFDPVQGITTTMRDKEDAEDYRYFADPDLPPLHLTDERISEIRESMPELPEAKYARFVNDLGLSNYSAEILSSDRLVGEFFDRAVLAGAFKDKLAAYKLVANWIVGDLFAAMKEHSVEMPDLKITPESMAKLIELVQDGTISGKIAKSVFEQMWLHPEQAPKSIVERLGLVQISDDGAISAAIEDILSTNENSVRDYLQGKEAVYGFFVGQIMKHFHGKANPEKVNSLLRQALQARKD